MLGASIPLFTLEYLFRTHFFLKPLDPALAKAICIQSLVRLADVAALTATLFSWRTEELERKANYLQSGAGAAWLSFRLYDIWVGGDRIGASLMHLDFMPHEGFGALRAQQIQNFVDSSLRYVVDSQYGLGAFHAAPLKVIQAIEYGWLETRLGQTAISLGLPAIIACSADTSNARDLKKFTGLRHFIAYGIIIGYIQYFWTTRLFFKPLDSAMVKSMTARSLVSSLDVVALFATAANATAPREHKAGIARSTLGAFWLAFRLTDIWKGENQIAFRLAHLDAAPLKTFFPHPLTLK